MAQPHLLQVEDGAERRNVGTTTGQGSGAVRVKAPDTDSLLSLVRDAVANGDASELAKLNELLAALQGVLQTQVTNLPGDYPDATAAVLLTQLRDGASLSSREATLQLVLAELENLISDGGTVNIGNHPADFPDAVAQGHLSNRYGGGRSAVAQVCAPGTTTLVAPLGSQRVQLAWVAFVPDPQALTSSLVTVKLGVDAVYTGYALAHWELFTGELGAPLTVVVDGEQSVAVTAHYSLV